MIEDAYRKCAVCSEEMPAWSSSDVCYKHRSKKPASKLSLPVVPFIRWRGFTVADLFLWMCIGFVFGVVFGDML